MQASGICSPLRNHLLRGELSDSTAGSVYQSSNLLPVRAAALSPAGEPLTTAAEILLPGKRQISAAGFLLSGWTSDHSRRVPVPFHPMI